MSEPFVGQLMLVGFNFAPKGWAFAAGQILPISQNTALFSLLGTMYGGNGTSTYALPDLRSRVPIGFGQGPGLQNYVQGETSGSENVTLIQNEMPIHTHNIAADPAPGNTTSPVSAVPARLTGGGTPYAPSGSSLNQQMSQNMLSPAGNNLAHNNLMPYLALNWIIALQGVFPSRN
jgi:microcystin-dependent protein